MNRPHGDCTSRIDEWIARQRIHVEAVAPDLLDLFDVFANEALFGREWLRAELQRLPKGAKVLEVGGGVLLLSSQLAREGVDITVLEPIGEGFSSFSKLQRVLLKFAEANNARPTVLNIPIETLSLTNTFDFSFSINVMEHIENIELGLSKVIDSLKIGGVYRFICPNYLFPYEPHFNIPIFFSKRWTEHLMRKQIFNSDRVLEPIGMWRSLNWINVYRVRKACLSRGVFEIDFHTDGLAKGLERITTDPIFASRRSGLIRSLARFLVKTHLHKLTCYLPAVALPVIDCSIKSPSTPIALLNR